MSTPASPQPPPFRFQIVLMPGWFASAKNANYVADLFRCSIEQPDGTRLIWNDTAAELRKKYA